MKHPNKDNIATEELSLTHSCPIFRGEIIHFEINRVSFIWWLNVFMF